jgi:hypothetical protein
MPRRVLRGLPLQDRGLGAPIIAARSGGRRHPTCPRAQLFPLRHNPSEGVRPFAAVSFGQHLIAVPEGPVAVGIGAKAAVEPPDGPAPRGWRQAQHALHGGH